MSAVIMSTNITPIASTSSASLAMDRLSIEGAAALTAEPAEPAGEISGARSDAKNDWAETALTVLFTAAAILFVSFLAVVSGLV